ncbi:MAG TPA: alanine/glycine:cation symporter family protein, partial [Noviherbaspirillum sp.]
LTLAQLYKTRNEDGGYRRGPASYMARGLRAPWAGAVFSVCLILAFGLVFNAVQANSIAESMEGAFGFSRLWVGIGLALATGFVIFGGIRQVTRVSEVVVPFMALACLLVTLYVIIANIAEVPRVFGLIIGSAFGLDAAAGGVAGAMLNGVKRGLFSNEAGMGSAPNIAAVATPDPHHPSAQGLVQALGVFIDTLMICSAPAFLILLSGTLAPGSGLTGTPLTQAAMRMHIGATGDDFVAIATFFFSFTSIIGNYSYAKNAMTFLRAGGRVGITLLRFGVLAMVVWGALESVTTVFNAADASMGLMATVNMIAIVLLSGTVAKLTRNYRRQRKAGMKPVLDMANFLDWRARSMPASGRALPSPKFKDRRDKGGDAGPRSSSYALEPTVFLSSSLLAARLDDHSRHGVLVVEHGAGRIARPDRMNAGAGPGRHPVALVQAAPARSQMPGQEQHRCQRAARHLGGATLTDLDAINLGNGRRG